MSFFGKLKGAILGTQEKNTANIFITDKRYIPTYTIADWQPKIKMPEYDPLFSLNKYLESIDLPRQTVHSFSTPSKSARIISLSGAICSSFLNLSIMLFFTKTPHTNITFGIVSFVDVRTAKGICKYCSVSGLQ